MKSEFYKERALQVMLEKTSMSSRKIRGLFEINKTMMDMEREITAAIISTFLAVVMWGQNRPHDKPLTILELSEKIGLPYQTVSRHLRYLGVGERAGDVGMGLVETREYTMNRRQKTVHLTNKGKSTLARLMFLLESNDDRLVSKEIGTSI